MEEIQQESQLAVAISRGTGGAKTPKAITASGPMQEQACLSGLAFLGDPENLEDSSSSSSLEQWNTPTDPQLLGGWRDGHASVVVVGSEDKEAHEFVVVLGGQLEDKMYTSSVLILDSFSLNKQQPQWKWGPSLMDKRDCLAAAVCNGIIYAIGGKSGAPGKALDTMEFMDVPTLLKSCSNMKNHPAQWKRLKCRLSCAKYGCATAVVHDRYIVILGGHNGRECLSNVDVLDTCRDDPVVVPLLGACQMNVPRRFFGAGVMGNAIYVVGGCGENGGYHPPLACVEALEFQDMKNPGDDVSTVFLSSSWTT